MQRGFAAFPEAVHAGAVRANAIAAFPSQLLKQYKNIADNNSVY